MHEEKRFVLDVLKEEIDLLAKELPSDKMPDKEAQESSGKPSEEVTRPSVFIDLEERYGQRVMKTVLSAKNLSDSIHTKEGSSEQTDAADDTGQSRILEDRATSSILGEDRPELATDASGQRLDGETAQDDSEIQSTDTGNTGEDPATITPQSDGKDHPDEEDLEKKGYAAINVNADDRTALCLSGGGIRSATFSLGVLQGLAEEKSLEEIDYLSTVSGGGFVGSWLSRWIGEEEDGVKSVSRKLRNEGGSNQQLIGLRQFSSYLSPQRGFTTDSITLGSIVLRNLFLCWLVLVPFILAVLMIPRLFAGFYEFLLDTPKLSGLTQIILVSLALALFSGIVYLYTRKGREDVALGKADRLVRFILVAITILIAIALSILLLKRFIEPAQLHIYAVLGVPVILLAKVLLTGFGQALFSGFKVSEFAMERGARFSAMLIRIAFLWTVLFALVLVLPQAFFRLLSHVSVWVAGVGGVGAAAGIVFAFISRGKEDPSEFSPSWRGWLQRNMLPLISGLTLTVISIGLTLLTSTVATVSESERKSDSTPTKKILDEESIESYLDWSARLDKEMAELKGEIAPSPKEAPIEGKENESDADSDTSEHRDTSRIILDIAKERVAREEAIDIESPPSVWENRMQSLAQLHTNSIEKSNPILWSIAFLIMIVMSAIFSAAFGVNRFSLHSMYKNRLVRGYLSPAVAKSKRQTRRGFSESDDIALSRLEGVRPIHIINATLNIGKGSDRARQDRKGESFTFSKYFSGSKSTGLIPTESYGGLDESGISLGRAMTISGAAVSPSMGYHSSRLAGALLTFFNARLGWWLPNPEANKRVDMNLEEPNLRLLSHLSEMFGVVSARSDYVYLSDGGHFENMGLYEMIRRRCRRIIVVDAGRDAEFDYESLSTALRLIRVDFDVEVEFDPEAVPACGKEPKERFILGRIKYKAVDGDSAKDGVLIYIKPVLLGDEPVDVKYYADKRSKRSSTFPHESTADQFFDELQFESYRKLGLASVKAVNDKHGPLHEIELPKFSKAATSSIEAEDNDNREDERQEDVTGALTLLDLLATQASNWVAPALATTFAASAAVALSVNVAAPESIALDSSKLPASLAMVIEKEDRALLERLSYEADPNTVGSLSSKRQGDNANGDAKEPNRGDSEYRDAPGSGSTSQEDGSVYTDEGSTTPTPVKKTSDNQPNSYGIRLNRADKTFLGSSVKQEIEIALNKTDQALLSSLIEPGRLDSSAVGQLINSGQKPEEGSGVYGIRVNNDDLQTIKDGVSFTSQGISDKTGKSTLINLVEAGMLQTDLSRDTKSIINVFLESIKEENINLDPVSLGVLENLVVATGNKKLSEDIEAMRESLEIINAQMDGLRYDSGVVQ